MKIHLSMNTYTFDTQTIPVSILVTDDEGYSFHGEFREFNPYRTWIEKHTGLLTPDVKRLIDGLEFREVDSYLQTHHPFYRIFNRNADSERYSMKISGFRHQIMFELVAFIRNMTGNTDHQIIISDKDRESWNQLVNDTYATIPMNIPDWLRVHIPESIAV